MLFMIAEKDVAFFSLLALCQKLCQVEPICIETQFEQECIDKWILLYYQL